MINGLDISNVNGHVDVAALTRQHHLSFAFFKATEGLGFRDPLFPAAWKTAKTLGLARGCYHFGRPVTDAVAQADAFLTYVRAAGLDDTDMLALDLEVSDGRHPGDVAAWGRQFCGQVHTATGRAPLVYTFLSFAQEGNCAGLGNYPLWIADPSSPPGRPRIPAPWSAWAIHQYGQQGTDLDIANYPDATVMTRTLGQQPAPKPPPKGWTAAMLADIPELAEGTDDARLPHEYVHRAQLILNGVFHAAPQLAADGKFGPATANAVGVLQGGYQLPVTRKLDAATWALLLAGVKP